MNQFQSAYEQGKMDKWDRITQTMDKVRAEHEAGKYVVVFESLSYCPYTDAAMGHHAPHRQGLRHTRRGRGPDQ